MIAPPDPGPPTGTLEIGAHHLGALADERRTRDQHQIQIGGQRGAAMAIGLAHEPSRARTIDSQTNRSLGNRDAELARRPFAAPEPDHDSPSRNRPAIRENPTIPRRFQADPRKTQTGYRTSSIPLPGVTPGSGSCRFRRHKPRHYAWVSRARPLLRRAFKTARPPRVAMRARKPNLRLRLIFDGCHIIFMVQFSSLLEQNDRFRIPNPADKSMPESPRTIFLPQTTPYPCLAQAIALRHGTHGGVPRLQNTRASPIAKHISFSMFPPDCKTS